MRADQVILGTVLSEKAVNLSAANIYTLKVNPKATKSDIAQALKSVFNVDAIDVNTSVTRGKVRRKTRAKGYGPVDVKANNVKKAFVRLKDGQSLPVATVAPEAATTETK